MSTQNEAKVPSIDERDMENVELHRAESMVNEKVEILDQITIDKVDKSDRDQTVNDEIHAYIGGAARSLGTSLINSSVEIIMFLYMFSYVMRSITSTTMIMEKVCRIHLGYSLTVCSDLAHNPAIKSEVEKLSNTYHLGHSLIQMTPSAILALFIGSWSDKYGRKPPVICALVGIILDGFGTIMCAYNISSRVEYYYIPALFTGFSGGFISVLMVLYSYASDVTSHDKRTMKYAFMEVAFGISMPLGILAGGWLYKFTGYVPVFLTSTCGHILGLFWVIFYLEETKGLDNKGNWKKKFIDFWTLDSVVSSFKATTKKRPNQGRKQIWLLILAMSIAIFSFASLSGIMFFYVYHRYNWENTTYSTWSAVYSIIGLGLMLVIVPFSKKRNIDDPILGIVGSVSLLLKNIVTGLASKVWIFHIAYILGLLNTLGTLAGRTRISKVTSKEDLGKVFAFMTTSELFLPIVATAIVSQSFNATLDFFPGLIFVIMGTLIVIPLGVFIWISRLPTANYEEMEENQKEDNVQSKTQDASRMKY